ncbi:MAG TPA: Uma2 family endonuclease [Kofleriaceae bacterium]
MDDHWSYTVQDYVELEDSTDLKHEFYRGDIRAMSGGTNEHARLGAALVGLLYPQLGDGPCEMFSSDLRVRIGDLITYPDASVVCGDVQMDVEDPNALLNPTVVMEVTSPSSEKYDRGGKFAHYQRIPSLREYVIVSHRDHLVEVFRRGEDGDWLEAEGYGPGQRALIQSIGCELDVETLYRNRRTLSSARPRPSKS